MGFENMQPNEIKHLVLQVMKSLGPNHVMIDVSTIQVKIPGSTAENVKETLNALRIDGSVEVAVWVYPANGVDPYIIEDQEELELLFDEGQILDPVSGELYAASSVHWNTCYRLAT